MVVMDLSLFHVTQSEDCLSHHMLMCALINTLLLSQKSFFFLSYVQGSLAQNPRTANFSTTASQIQSLTHFVKL